MKTYKNILFYCIILSALNSIYADDKIDFEKDVYPIIKSRCFKCHHEKKQKGKFSFETRDKVLKGGKEGSDVIIGNSKDSLLIKLLETEDDDDVMPQKGDRLTKEEIQKLKDWIDQGLDWKEISDDKKK